jgi:hypothetical protein
MQLQTHEKGKRKKKKTGKSKQEAYVADESVWANTI